MNSEVFNMIRMLMFFFSLSVSSSIVGQEKKANTQKEIYQAQRSAGYFDVIEINNTQDSVKKGAYYGVEIGIDNKLIFYRAEFKASPVGVYNFGFLLSNLIFSTKPFYDGKFKYSFKAMDSTLPDFLRHPMTFLGEFDGNQIKIQRITSKYMFSNCDRLIFNKTDAYPVISTSLSSPTSLLRN